MAARKKREKLVPFVEALRAIEAAAIEAGVSVPISAETCEQFVTENAQTAIDETALGSTGNWWAMMVADSAVLGMYVTVEIDGEVARLRAGKGSGPALRRFSDQYFGKSYQVATARLEARFGKPFWRGAVDLTEIQ